MNENSERSRQAAILFAAIIGGIFLTALLFLLVYEIRGVLPPFIYAFIIVYLLRPLVSFFVSKNIPRIVAVSLVYLLVLLVMTVIFVFLLPLVIVQVKELVSHFPEYLKAGLGYFSQARIAFYKIDLPKGVEPILTEIGVRARAQAYHVFSGLPETTAGVFGGLLNLILAPIIAFYVLKDLPVMKETVIGLFPPRYREEIFHVLKEIDFAVGGFLRGQILVSLVVGTTIGVFLLAFGVNFAILLGMLAGILNIIPYFGPVFGGGVAAIIALFQSPRLALIVVIGMIVIQQIDSAIISPIIMRHAVNLHPVVVILALLIGGTLFGFLGLLIAIPIAAVAKALLLHYVYSQPVELTDEA
ncbi:MAG: AI-2E family transporter [Actinomycetota bacterium]|nr:AI-2E family transporter [Actinomycetota bacterium]